MAEDHPPLSDEAVAARLRLVLARLARRLRQSTPLSLTVSQVSALATVEEMEPVRLSDLAHAEGISLPTLSRMAAALETSGLLVREPDPADGRAARLHITPDGRDELKRLRTERAAAMVERLAVLAPDQRAALVNALDALETLAKCP